MPADGALLESVFRAAPVGIGVVKDRVLQWVNARVCEISGYELDELVGRSARVLYPTDEEFTYVGDEKYRQILERGTGTVETRWRRKDGTLIDVQLSSTPFCPDDWSAGVTFTVLDITARRAAEAALKESHALYRDVVELSPDPIGIVQGDRVCFVNSAYTRVFGYSCADVEKGLPFMAMLQEQDRPAMRERYAQRMAGEAVSSTLRIDLLAKDGHTVPCETSATVITHEGKPADLILVRDITERLEREAAQRRWAAHVRQAEKLESLGLLAGGIAHDFNNLLVGVLGNLSLALDELNEHASVAQCLREAEASAIRVADLVRQLLAYAGKAPLTMLRVHWRPIIDDAIRQLQGFLSKEAELRIRIDDGVPAVDGDPAQLRQIVMSLITNASEALDGQGGSIEVSVRQFAGELETMGGVSTEAHPAGDLWVCLAVSDTGAGMDEETQAKIFDPFFSTKFTGRGLGLAAVAGIVRRHGGALRVESAPGKGTTLSVFLPPNMTPEPEHPVGRPLSWHGSGRLLLVDDEPSVRAVARRALGRLGFEVVEARGGLEALEVFGEAPHEYVAVVLDLTMPDLDGEQTLRRLRAIRGKVPILLSSGYGEQVLSERFPDMQGVGFIQKPFSLDVLADRLRVLLGSQG